MNLRMLGCQLPGEFLKDGAIWIIGSYHNILELDPLFKIKAFVLNDVVWHKSINA